jgi:hypothetical protein
MRNLKYVILTAAIAICVIGAEPRFEQDEQDEDTAVVQSPFIYPDVEKPHSACAQTECWDDCTDEGYESTCTQAASANVLYALCNFWCFSDPEEIYQDLVNSTGNLGQFPEDEVQSMQEWVTANCPVCSLRTRIVHKGYAGQAPVDSEYVTFTWPDLGVPLTEHVKIWVVGLFQLPYPAAPTSRQDLSQELTYMGRMGDYIFVHDSDCDMKREGNNFYQIDWDENGEYIRDYFGPGDHGYLHGVTFIWGPR